MAVEGPEKRPSQTTGPSLISSGPRIWGLVSVFPAMIWPLRTSRWRSMSEVPTQIPTLLVASTPPTPSVNVPMKATLPSFPIFMSPNEANVPVVPAAAVPSRAIGVVVTPSPRKMPLRLAPPVKKAPKAARPRSFKISGPKNWAAFGQPMSPGRQ